MAIFKHELRQLRSHTLWWSVAVTIAILVILPSYINMLTSGAVDAGAVMNNDFFGTLGVDASIISTPIGTYGFITSFFVIAAGINGMFLGLKTFTKETAGNTAEYTYTKPYRRTSIFCAKVLSALLSALTVGVFYYVASTLAYQMGISGNFDFKSFSLIALSFLLIELFFVLFGACVGTIYSKIRTPLLAVSGVVFMFYIFSAFASKADVGIIKFLTPFSWFGASQIVINGGYNTGYIVTLIVLCVLFAITGFGTFIKKDISFIS
jgi:ABC-2 type transport system permease protein